MRILIADDHDIVRKAVRALLVADGHDVVEAASGTEAVRLAEEVGPDVVLMDLRMPPGMDGLEATRQIVARRPACRVVVLSAYADETVANRAVVSGAVACLPKVVSYADLCKAIETAMAGKQFVWAGPDGRSGVDGGARPAALSERETQVLQQLADGYATKEVAARLGISVKTAESHRRNVMEKLGLDSLAQATKYALRHGLTRLDGRGGSAGGEWEGD
jgi:DNA-binding NarL/FixJ family response regulator